jgi:hypothetical protein
MNPVETFAAGIAPHHVPPLIATLLLPVLVMIVRRLRRSPTAPMATGTGPGPRPTTVQRWAAWLLGVAAAVHLALPLGHYDGPLLTVGFVGSGAAYAWLAVRAVEGRPWRLAAAPLLAATLLGYLIVTGTGREEPDQVGIATALVELAALGLCLVPARTPGRPRRFARFAGSVATVGVTLLVGLVVWVQFFVAHDGAEATADPASATLGHDHADGHGHSARAQAGVIMRPASGPPATAAQVAAADELAEATAKAMANFVTLDAALAAGYAATTPADGMDVHLEHKSFKQDGRILDPERPEQLVYAIAGGRATLLGVVYVMERAGVPAPEPGGPITRWHSHNICLTLLPPGFGVVTPFGNCPALSVHVTIPEMMHVWVVDNPAGPFSEGLDATWVNDYHSKHGIPYDRR